jgi:peptidoglycan/LPS O-acetylase OafA/YrhL
MTTRSVVEYLIDNDFTALYAVLVWAGVMLAVAWVIMMRDDPANSGLPEWDLRMRRAGIVTMVAGFILSVLFGGNQQWAPWPTMIVVVLGFDFYLASAILTQRHRVKIRDAILGQPRVGGFG